MMPDELLMMRAHHRDCGPACGYKQLLSLIDEQAATIERLKREITLLRQEVDEAKYKDTVEVDGLTAIGRLAVLIHEQTEDAIARDAAVEIQNIVRGGERG